MLSTDEQQARYDIQGDYDAEAEEPAPLGRHRSPRGGPPDPRGVDDLPAVVVAGIWSAVFLVIFGEMAAASAVATAAAVGWALWRWVMAPRHRLGGCDTPGRRGHEGREAVDRVGAAAHPAVAFGGVTPAEQGRWAEDIGPEERRP